MSTKSGHKSGAAQLDALTLELKQNLKAETSPRPRATPAPNQLMNFSTSFKAQAAELERLKVAKAEGFAVSLSSLVDSPYHLLPIEEERVLALMENLRENPLVTPIGVRAVGDTGQFEVIAGRHRVAAYRRLGRTEIFAVLSGLSDDEAERAVFYDNLFAPSICDYEKYLGFSRRQKSKGWSHAELAKEAGVSRSLITHLFAFESLPETARTLIAENPRKASAALFVAMSPFSEKSPDLVVDAISKVLEGSSTVTEAISSVKRRPSIGSGVQGAREIFYRSGRKTFATLNIRGRAVNVAFKDEEEAKAAVEHFKKYLEERVSGGV